MEYQLWWVDAGPYYSKFDTGRSSYGMPPRAGLARRCASTAGPHLPFQYTPIHTSTSGRKTELVNEAVRVRAHDICTTSNAALLDVWNFRREHYHTIVSIN